MKPVERVGDRFTLEKEIGSGGMSTVYLGRDEVLDRPVAVKILRGSVEGFTHPADVDLGTRFEREGRTAARLSHTNIVQVYDAGKDVIEDFSIAGVSDRNEPASKRSVSYIVMEYVSGGDLKELIDREGPLSGRRLTRVGASIASGLSHAHERGVVHRDIKPQNVLLDEYGNPKLTDFGIARAFDPDGASNMTKTGHYLGTALYSAPEQLNGESATPKSDVYSLGTTLYHVATGEPPFSGSPIEVATQQMNRDPRPPTETQNGITTEMEGVILACLAKNPDDRPTASEVQKSLYRAGLAVASAPGESAPGATGALGASSKQSRRMDGPPSETVSLPTRTFRGSRDRGPLIVGAVAVVFLLTVLLGAFALLGGGGSEDAASNSNVPSEGGAADENAGQPGQGNGSGGGNPGDGNPGDGGSDGEEQAVTEETTVEETTPEETTSEDTGPLPPTEEAGSVVFDYYVALAEGRFDDAWANLSSDYQEELGGTVGDLEEQESSLNGVFFEEGVPQATLDGREARVDFSVGETRGGTTQEISGTWVSVNEDGEWKLDRLEE